MVKVKVTNPNYDMNIKPGTVIDIPVKLLGDFLLYKHGEVVREKKEPAPAKDKAVKRAPKNKNAV